MASSQPANRGHREYAGSVAQLRQCCRVLWRSQAVFLAVSLASVLSLNASVGWAQQADHVDRVEGVIQSVQAPDAIRVQTPNGLVTVDLAALGGVTALVTPGQRIVAIGTMESSGNL